MFRARTPLCRRLNTLYTFIRGTSNRGNFSCLYETETYCFQT